MGVSDYSTTPGSNTTINSINIAEGCAPSGINNAIRQAMADTASNLAWLEKTTAYTAVRYDSVLCDTVTTGAFTLTLPASPSNGDWVRVGSSSSWASNNLTIGRNSQSIRGAGSDLTLSDAGNVSYLFVFDGTTWQYYVTADDTTGVVTSGTPVANDFARFTDASTVEGRSYAEVKADLSLEIGTDVQAQGAVLDDLNTLGANSADGEVAVGTGAGALAWESGATLRTSIGVGTGDSPQLTGIELGHATDTTIGRTSAGVANVEGADIYTAGTAIAAADGGTIGQQTIWIPGGAMEARVTTAPATSNAVEIATSLLALRTMDFATDADDHAGFAIQMPKGWDESTLIAQFIWSNASGTGGVTWAIQAGAYADSDALTTALGTAVTVDDTMLTAGDVHVSPESSAITVAGSPGAEEWVYFQVYRDVSDANDTLAVDARLHGVKIHYTINAGTDS